MKEVIQLLEELVALQEQRLQRLAKSHIPNLTKDDLLQPCDFPVLENNPEFRYEEGVREGILSSIAAIRARFYNQV